MNTSMNTNIVRMNNTAIMKSYRAKGYTNQQIADVCGVSYANVLSKLGRQPRELTCRSAFIGACHRWNVDRAALRREVAVCEHEYQKVEREYQTAVSKLKHANSRIETVAKMLKAVN